MKNRRHALRKAAILIASLDHETAAALLDQMSAEQAQAVRATIAELDDVLPGEQQAVIEEFFRIGPLVPEKTPPGIELDGPSARQLAAPSAASHSARHGSRRSAYEPHVTQLPPFQFLEETTSTALARYLQRERPQTIAVVISHLASDRGAEILGLLPAELQGEVTLRLAQLDQTPPEIVDEIERGMQSWLTEQTRDRRTPGAGLETLRGILAAADGQAKSAILRNLAQHDRRLANRLAAAPPRSSRSSTSNGSTILPWPMQCGRRRARFCCWPWPEHRARSSAGSWVCATAIPPRGSAGGWPISARCGSATSSSAQQELADVARQCLSAGESGEEKKHLSVAV